MLRAEIIDSGDAQRVGLLDAVQRIARDLGRSGTVQNLEPYDVRIVAEGGEAALKEFIKAINIQEGPINVQALHSNWTAATCEFQYFKIMRGDWQEELEESLDVAVGLLHRSIEVSEENLNVSKENLSIGKMMLEKQDQMLEKQDETLGEIRAMRADLREYTDKRKIDH